MGGTVGKGYHENCFVVVCKLAASQQQTRAFQERIYFDKCTCCRSNLLSQTSHTILTLGQSVEAVTLQCQDSRVASPVPVLKPLVSKRTSLQRRVPDENSMATISASVKRKIPSGLSRCQGHRGMTTTCCPGSSKSFWWGFTLDITDWTVICTANWSWHPHQPAPEVKKTKPQSMFNKDAPVTKPQDVWPVSTSLTTKLYGCKQELENTSFISRAALIMYSANAKKKKKPLVGLDLGLMFVGLLNVPATC